MTFSTKIPLLQSSITTFLNKDDFCRKIHDIKKKKKKLQNIKIFQLRIQRIKIKLNLST